MTKNVKAMIYEGSASFPTEIHVGNTLIATDSANQKSQSMMLYMVEAKGLQLKEFNRYLSRQSNSEDIYDINNTETNQSIISVHDAVIPESKDWIKHGIYFSQNIMMGKVLSKQEIYKYSCIAYEMMAICFNNAYNNEKTVVYHNKINNFGILQYMTILQFNGCIIYGKQPSHSSICKYCRHTFQEHQMSVKDRISKNICNKFKGIYVTNLIGDITQKERDFIVNEVYNHPNNLWGDLMSIIFVSDVAYSGVSFFNTNNLLIISRIPNISKWRQIYSRVIRTQSHQQLPPHKRYAKIYTMAIYSPEKEKIESAYNNMYYKLRIILNEDIHSFLKILSKNNMGDLLFNKPQELTLKTQEKEILETLFMIDVNTEIKNIFDKIRNKVSNLWKLSTLISRIKANKNMLTFINLNHIPDNVIYMFLLNNKVIKTFKYEYSNDIYVELYGSANILSKTAILSYFKFNQLKSIDVRNTNFNNLLNQLKNATSIKLKIQYIANIIKLFKNKYDALVDKHVFWDAVYDIHDEYYPDDETNFIYNHQRENRNRETFTGCYYGSYIIFKNGSYKTIDLSFNTQVKPNPYPYMFKITCLSFSEYSPYYIHVSIIQNDYEKDKDKRKFKKGISCYSFDVTKLKSMFPTLDEFKKKTFCMELIFELCKLQHQKQDVKFVMTPFEK
jgi:hypothetical protein